MGKAKATSINNYDYPLLVAVLLLLGFSLLMVYSASSHIAAYRIGDSNYYLKRQATFCLFGLLVMLLARYVPVRIYGKLAYPILLLSLGLLMAVFIPGLGKKVGGAYRWLKVGPLTIQPAEFAKFALGVYMAYSMAKKGSQMASFWRGIFPHLVVAGVVMGLLVSQPDLGTAVIIGAWLFIMLFVGGCRFHYLLSLVLCAIPFVYLLVIHVGYRLKRWWAFLNPWKDPTGVGFQIIHSFFAFGSGGLLGVGIGASKQKLFYLPEPHTDFVFSIVGEELGFLGVCGVVAVFCFIIVRGVQISLSAKDLYSTYLGFGLTALLGLQVLINMAVVLGLLPTKGLTLPLLSYGGSSMVVTLLSVGVLLNIASQSK